MSGYPLEPYLRYADYSARLERTNPDDLAAFLDRYPEAPFTVTLRQRWLRHLGESRHWQQFVRFYRDGAGSVSLACYFGRALHHTGQDDEAIALGLTLWTAGQSQPSECDPLFEKLIDGGHITEAVAWQRYTAALLNHDYRLADYAGRFLTSRKMRELASLYLQADRDPAILAETERFPARSPEEVEIVRHGLTHLAVSDPRLAMELWHHYRQSHGFSEAQQASVISALVRGLYRAGHRDSAERYLAEVHAIADDTLLDWLLRELIDLQDWRGVVTWSERLLPGREEQTRWRYWRPRALALLGENKDETTALFQALSRQRSFYGFLASEWLGKPYAMEHRPLEIPDERASALAASPAMLRVRELYHHGEDYWARREWYAALAGAGEEEWLVAAKLAQRNQWHHLAIMSMIRANYWDDIDIRFPVPHEKLFLAQSEKTGVPVNLLLALGRQESAFATRATSPAGARGLMQLMPATARDTAQRRGIRYGGSHDLYNPETNIILGSAYYRQMLSQFNENKITAIAAYNAGPGRVRTWLKRSGGTLPPDAWIETIPFPETRNYVQNVLTFSVIYGHHLGLEAGILGDPEL